MLFFNLFVNFMRVILIAFAGIFIFKKQYKAIVFIGANFLLTFLLELLYKFLDIKVDSVGSYLYICIAFMTLFLGNGLKFYDKFAWWDRLIHFLSGIMFVSFGIALSHKAENLQKLYILYFCVTFSIAHHVIWEVLEYFSDCFFHTDNQRWQKVSASVNHASPDAIQPAGLVDTMNDTIACIVGTLTSCAVWWFVL